MDERALGEERYARGGASPQAVFFDKTGTLTRCEFRVVEITAPDDLKPEDALALAAAVEHDSEHTIAQGIVKSAEERRLPVSRADGFQAIPGRGVQATVDGRKLLLAAMGAVLMSLSTVIVAVNAQLLRRAQL